MVKTEEFPLSSANSIPGYKIIKTNGFVYGLTVRSRGAGGQIGAGIKSMFGGEITQYKEVMEESREEALSRLIDHAIEVGGNAIIAVRYDSNSFSDIMQEVLAYGTAVTVEKE
ncbi:MAG: heavy metal-binding domain-containing protein [Methanobacteriaceae archaeon]|nr:heavy metal-binding domain-containing protein [Methanobacteriaceae archaeon]